VMRWSERFLRRLIDVSGERQIVEHTRADRAIEAIRDLARWLGTTEPEAAQIAGKYRRSYYNWLKGVQPYPARTLDLFEAHAFVASLVSVLGERAARAWLEGKEGSGSREDLLATSQGRSRLSRLVAPILFPEEEEVSWSPDDELTHGPPPASARNPRAFGRPALVAPSDLPRR
jgi:hypothetical protein